MALAQGNLVADYRFDQTSGTQLTDYSGNALHGTLNGSVSWQVAGIGALFPGSGNPSISLPTYNWVNGDFSYEALICPFQTPQGARIFDTNTTGSTDNYYLAVNNNNNQGITESFITTSGLNLLLFRWSYLQIVYASALGASSLYYNNILIAQRNGGSIAQTSRTNNNLGKSAFNNPYFVGIMTCFRYYSRVLTAAELAGNINYTMSFVASKMPIVF